MLQAALGDGDLVAIEIAVRMAIGNSERTRKEVDQLESLYASLMQQAPNNKTQPVSRT